MEVKIRMRIGGQAGRQLVVFCHLAIFFNHGEQNFPPPPAPPSSIFVSLLVLLPFFFFFFLTNGPFFVCECVPRGWSCRVLSGM